MEGVLLTTSLTIIALGFLAVIGLLGVVAMVHGQADVARMALRILGEWVVSVWKKPNQTLLGFSTTHGADHVTEGSDTEADSGKDERDPSRCV
jgi:hypothetical protein